MVGNHWGGCTFIKDFQMAVLDDWTGYSLLESFRMAMTPYTVFTRALIDINKTFS